MKEAIKVEKINGTPVIKINGDKMEEAGRIMKAAANAVKAEKIGKVLAVNDNPDEPVMDCVKEKDAEVSGIAVERLRSLVERIERLEEEKKSIGSDIGDIFAEAKSAGFDKKAIKKCISLRKMDAADRDAEELLLATYRKALDI